MKLTLETIDRKTGLPPDNDTLLAAAGFVHGEEYDGLSITDEGLPIVLNSVGEYGYLDDKRFDVALKLSVD